MNSTFCKCPDRFRNFVEFVKWKIIYVLKICIKNLCHWSIFISALFSLAAGTCKEKVPPSHTVFWKCFQYNWWLSGGVEEVKKLALEFFRLYKKFKTNASSHSEIILKKLKSHKELYCNWNEPTEHQFIWPLQNIQDEAVLTEVINTLFYIFRVHSIEEEDKLKAKHYVYLPMFSFWLKCRKVRTL